MKQSMTHADKSQNQLLAEIQRLQADVERLQQENQEKDDQCRELRKNEQCYKGLFEFAADAILQGNPQGNIVGANHRASLLTGYSHEELLGMNIARLFSEQEHSRKPLRYDLLQAGQVIRTERTLTRKDGRSVFISMNSKMMPDGSYHSFFRDVTDQKLAEKALKEREATLSSILRVAPIGIGLTQNRILTWCSDNLCQMLGYNREELMGQPARILYESEDEYERVGRTKYDQIGEGKVGEVETRWKCKNGTPIDILLKSTPLDSGDLSIGVTFTALDITERKEAEDQQREMARMKSEFIATASHELRTPLTVVRGYLELLLNNDHFSRQEQHEFLTCIYDKTMILERLVDELLDISRIESGRSIYLERSPVRLTEVVEEIVRQFRQESPQHTINSVLENDDAMLFVDRGKLVQVLENLVGNAVKFSPRGGSIVIRGELRDESYQVTVSDEGIGLDFDQQEKVFEKFYRVDNSNTAAKGLGIGLFLVKNIVEAHQGKVWLDSTPGQGSHFSFSLPLPLPLLDASEPIQAAGPGNISLP